MPGILPVERSEWKAAFSPQSTAVYNEFMTDRKRPTVSATIAAATYLIPLFLVILVTEPLRIAFGLVLGCVFVWAAVRWTNRWRDPSRARIPPDRHD